MKILVLGATSSIGEAGNMPPAGEPDQVKRDLAAERARHQTAAASRTNLAGAP